MVFDFRFASLEISYLAEYILYIWSSLFAILSDFLISGFLVYTVCNYQHSKSLLLLSRYTIQFPSWLFSSDFGIAEYLDIDRLTDDIDSIGVLDIVVDIEIDIGIAAAIAVANNLLYSL